MNAKKMYIAIAVVFGIAYASNLYWLFRLLVNMGGYNTFRFTYLIRYLPIFAGITGLIIFLQSKFKRSNLFRVMMCLEITSFPFVAVWYLLYFTQEARFLNHKLPVNWQVYFGIVLNALLFISSIIGLRMLSLNKTARLTYVDYDGERSAQFTPAKAEVRFANRSVDALLIIYVLLINLGSYSTFTNYGTSLFEPEYIFVLEIPFLLLYYIILEGIFNTTAGKCATGTTIANANGERPGFGQIVGRTFCRLIPFEAFSFFTAGARGWHDTFSNTYVVSAINKEDAFMDEIIFDAELENPPL
jgi:uncharacterized RDD family membrane protein YckC